MYAYLKGKLIENAPTFVILDVNGIGYKISVPPHALHLPLNEECTLYTSFVIRENSQALYGFLETDARDLFEMLIAISGIGPKTALCLLSKFTPASLQKTVLDQNVALIATVPGIGKKTAERLVFDIRDKMTKLSLDQSSALPLADQTLQDALGALMNLGFTQNHAKKALEKVMSDQDGPKELSDIITAALRQN